MAGKLTVFFVALAAGITLYQATRPQPVRLPNGLIVRQVPWQVTHPEGGEFWRKGEFTLQNLAEFRIQARVVSKERYRNSYSAKIAPWDFAMVWGRASDQRVLDKCHFSQGDRWGNWFLEEGSGMTMAQMPRLFSNFHLIPASDAVLQTLGEIKVGSPIEISGKLVLVSDRRGWTWRSSLTRNDVGMGACEIVWVQRVRVLATAELTTIKSP